MDNKTFDAVKKIPSIAEKESWVITLDRDEGSLFYSPKVVPDNTQLRQITDEYAIYFDSANKPRGVMIEYYEHNFLKHHVEFKELNDIFKRNSSDILVVDPKTKDGETLVFKKLLEKTLILEALDNTLCPAA